MPSHPSLACWLLLSLTEPLSGFCVSPLPLLGHLRMAAPGAHNVGYGVLYLLCRGWATMAGVSAEHSKSPNTPNVFLPREDLRSCQPPAEPLLRLPQRPTIQEGLDKALGRQAELRRDYSHPFLIETGARGPTGAELGVRRPEYSPLTCQVSLSETLYSSHLLGTF